MLGWAEMQGWSRLEQPASISLDQALWQDRSLMRAWCMRGTLHLLTPEQHQVYTSMFEPETVYREIWLKWMGLTLAQARELECKLAQALDAGEPLSRRELGERLGMPIDSWGSLLGPAARLGLLVHGPPRGQEVTFVRPDRWLGRPQVRLDPAEARKCWLRRYLRSYGPATRRDYGRWTGFRTAAQVHDSFRLLLPELMEVEVDGAKLLALAADEEALGRADELDLPGRLLAGFEPFLLAHAERDHLLLRRHRTAVYRTAGWISPTVLLGGRVAGVWGHRLLRDRLKVTVTQLQRFGAHERRLVKAEAERLATCFGRPLVLAYT
ncbi:MAG: winged helix DNA-binding domain-containing protein [Candidatus Dormibacteraeota bacterium]|nr:winged helix DNA-binding domain-containing protein [Candidatus Dormibacteraeota bacterium]